MNHNGLDPSETDADSKRAFAALSDEHIDDPMHTKLSGDEHANCGSDADIMRTIAKS